jgi:lysozyme
MTFNLGWSALSRFHHFLEALHKGDYEEAANEMLASLWARQVGERAKRLATQMRTGVRAA